jgi:alcohol dehydrogenase (cytochrome c)
MSAPIRIRRVPSRFCLFLSIVGLVAAACWTSKPAAASVASAATTNATAAQPSGAWPYPNADLANTRQAPASVISSANVSQLQQAWTFRIPSKTDAGTGTMTMSPIVTGGVVYIQDMQSNVYALDLGTGKLRWEHQFNIRELGGPGPNGVAVAGGLVYGDTPFTVFALSAKTGKTVWLDRNLLPGSHGISAGQSSGGLYGANGVFDIQPQVIGGRVYLSSAIGSGPGGGILFALGATTGKVIWKFNTMVGPHASVSAVGSGGAWEPPLVSSDGSVTFGIGNPYQSPATAIAHPERLLYSDSAVNLDAATGKLRWYYQAVPNDFLDHDLQASPIEASSNGTSVIIAAGKVGYVYAVNAQTGALLWKTPVGVHNGHDNDSALAMEHKLHLSAPVTFEPAALGGVLSNPAVADNTVYVSTVDEPITYTKLSQYLGGAASSIPTGEIEALNLATGAVEWDTKLPQMALSGATVSGDLVFSTLYNGELIALSSTTGAIVYQHKLPTSANAPVDVFGNTVLVPAGGPTTAHGGGKGLLVAYTVH